MTTQRFFVILFAVLVFATPALGRPRHRRLPMAQPAQEPPTPAATPAPTPPAVSPDAMPSARLQAFLSAHLDEILAPLDSEGLKQSMAITDLRTTLADGLAKAAPAKQPIFRAAVAVSDALANAANERQTAFNNIQGLGASSSSNSLGLGGKNGQADAAFATAQRAQWVQRAAQLRQGIEQQYSRQRDVERQVSTSVQTDAVADARREAIERYPELGVADSKFNVVFLSRFKYYQQRQPAYFDDAAWPLRLAEEVAQTVPSR